MTKKPETSLPVLVNESIFLDTGKFEHAQRVCQMLAKSTMVPEHFRENIGNCMIALNYADRTGIDPFMAMQKMYVIHGKPAVEAQLQIALFNKSRNFTNLEYEMSGTGDAEQCVAYATNRESGKRIDGPPVSIKMAKAEGWFQKKGSKWQSLPGLMLRYRAAAFFIRLHAPETTLGLYTKEEMDDIEPRNITPGDQKALIKQNANQEIIDIETGPEPEPEADPAEKEAQKKKAAGIEKNLQKQTGIDPDRAVKIDEMKNIDLEVFEAARTKARIPKTKPVEEYSQVEFKKLSDIFSTLIDAAAEAKAKK